MKLNDDGTVELDPKQAKDVQFAINFTNSQLSNPDAPIVKALRELITGGNHTQVLVNYANSLRLDLDNPEVADIVTNMLFDITQWGFDFPSC